jgi:DMSO/TMAO reductase YedYZ molybdopterin-dependent catalytic subunit
MGLQAESITTDIHCVTRWSELDTAWRGVSLDTLLADVETEADWLTATRLQHQPAAGGLARRRSLGRL